MPLPKDSRKIEVQWDKLAFFDIETAGLVAGRHQMFQIGVVVAHAKLGAVRRQFVRRMNFEYTGGVVDPEALKLNGIDPKTWDGYPARQVLPQVWNFLADAGQIWGHGVQFDWGFLEPALRAAGYKTDMLGLRLRDTRTLAEPLVWAGKIANPRLPTVCDFFGVSNDGAHDALVDAERTFEIYRKLRRYYGPRLRARR